MNPNDPNVIEELVRERKEGMNDCLCSNCNPSGAVYLINEFKKLNKENFDQYVLDPELKDSRLTFPARTRVPRLATKDLPVTCSLADPIRLNAAMIDLTEGLMKSFKNHYYRLYGEYAPVQSTSLFTFEKAWSIAKNLEELNAGMPIDLILGSQAISGSHNRLSEFLIEWKTGDIGYEHMDAIKSAQIEQDQTELNIILENELIAQKKKDKEVKRNRDSNEREERKHAREEKRRMTRIDKERRVEKKKEDMLFLAGLKEAQQQKVN